LTIAPLPHHIHVIRLRGPWQLEPIEQYLRRDDGRFQRTNSGLPHSGRSTMPADWSGLLGRDFFGRVRYHRIFQMPTGLESGAPVWLVVEPPRSRGVVALGGRLLGEAVWGGPPARFKITERLEEHNRLEIIVEHPALDAAVPGDDDDFQSRPGGLVGEVRLEIEE
jgi:hypothetical protein